MINLLYKWLSLIAILFCASNAWAISDSDQIFNYLEAYYPQYLMPETPNSANWTNPADGTEYYYRYYANTKAYIGTSKGQVYYLGTLSDGKLTALGSVEYWLNKVSDAGIPAKTPVGTPNGAPTQATIGAAGGTVGTADGKIKLTIPPGALSADTPIGIQPISNNAHGGLGSGYRLTPDGLTFKQPVLLTFSYTDQDLEENDPELLGAAFQTTAGYWQWLGEPVVDNAAKTMSISTTHFTDVAFVFGYRIIPSNKALKINQTLSLQVNFCYPPKVNKDDDLQPLGNACKSVAKSATFSQWAVNGIPGGNSTVGTVSGKGPVATYTAPAKKPKNNLVKVSVRTSENRPLVAKISIIDHVQAYKGTITFTQINPNYNGGTLKTTGSADVVATYKNSPDDDNVSLYKFSGTIRQTFNFTPAPYGIQCESTTNEQPLNSNPGSADLTVYMDSHPKFPNSFSFTAMPNTIPLINCSGYPFPLIDAIHKVGDAECLDQPKPIPFTDDTHLAEHFHCDNYIAVGIVEDITWDLIATE